MIAIGFGSISLAELFVLLLAGATQLAILFLLVYWAVRVTQRRG